MFVLVLTAVKDIYDTLAIYGAVHICMISGALLVYVHILLIVAESRLPRSSHVPLVSSCWSTEANNNLL